ncbi:LysR family transcriptional regulator [Massilia sp. JS1662]|nr:LysR substrate-binding domain-containing protein [Massilia sp. JS1662]KGF79165.1 LysR family transcriptional regulator [Massilia sp. JS1662]
MHDLNDLAYFVAVVTHGGFSAAARATGLEKTRLSRRIAALEQHLGVRLLQRNTRSIALTAAGERFFAHAEALVEGARGAFDSVAALRATPAGVVRLSSPQVMAQTMLLPILPGFLARYPNVKIELDANDRHVDLLNERFDLALRARVGIEDSAGLVAKELGTVRQVLVASPALLDRTGRPRTPRDLAERDTFARPGDVHDGRARWALEDGGGTTAGVEHDPRLVTNDLRMQVEAAEQGIGIALLPEPIVAGPVGAGALEIVLPGWTGARHVVHLLYPSPRGMLPSVRSLIDYLSAELPPAFGRQKT